MFLTRCARTAASLAFLSFVACSKDALPSAADSDGDATSPADGSTGRSNVKEGADAMTASDANATSDAATASDASRDAASTAYNPCPPAGTPCAIMPLGDSITDGVGSSGAGGGYRVRLFHLANQNGRAITFVGSETNGPSTVDGKPFPRRHEGHSGFTIDDNSQRSGISPLVAAAMTQYKPHIITLMIGTNDVGLSLDLSNAPTRLGNLIDSILAADPAVLLVVAQIVPAKDASMNARVRAYNAGIPGLVATRAAAGKHVVSIDMYGAFTSNSHYMNDYMDDDLHPNDAGYVVMADTWYAAIGALLR
jgi:lysophospholipase L1-like esterase